MSQALYRKYRSTSFADVVAQEHVTKTLRRAIKSGRISHAYLFTGPRGVGKTSVARILAHEVNQLPYRGESIHLDIIEIDAASNRRIDEIRDLRERVWIAPAAAKYKVYIIDEVHMLTREAFNALLKTLEEPPAHCIFILATTEAHKLPETIISRTQRFEFKPVPAAQAAKHLATIAKKENLHITSGALQMLAEFGSGSFRDSIGYLDQLSSLGEEITEEDVRDLLGQPSAAQVQELVGQIKAGSSTKILESLQSIKDQGIDAAAVAAALSKQLRAQILSGQSLPTVSQLLKALLEVPASSQPYEFLEITLLEACQDSSSGTEFKIVSDDIAKPAKNSSSSAALKINKVSAIKPLDQNQWNEIMAIVKSQTASLYTALRLAEPIFAADEVLLRFQFPLHQKKVDHAENKHLIASIIEETTGIKAKIVCEVDKSLFDNRSTILKGSTDNGPVPLHSISNIFGGAEILEG